MGPVELLQPLVLDPISISEFVEYILYKHNGPSILIVCGTKDAFLEQLTEALLDPSDETDTHGESSSQDAQTSQKPQKPKSALVLAPTLRFLASSRTLKLAFCPDVTHLRAYLAKLSLTAGLQKYRDEQPGACDSFRILAILNPIALHEPTSSFSAQGFNRIFSVAIDTAYRMGAKLVMGECPTTTNHDRSPFVSDLQPFDVDPDDKSTLGKQAADGGLWDQQVSILNVTTKSFGAGERGWVGRTVKLRTIAERWCIFESTSNKH